MIQLETCRICDAPTEQFATARVLKKYDVAYFCCKKCSFVQTEKPYWLAEAYQDAIIRSDIGLVARNIRFCGIAQSVINARFDPNARFVDYGGGYGMFVRLMRDNGFDFYRLDPHCENLFARGFDANLTARHELLTAFEVFEHLADPMQEIMQMLNHSRSILFSTRLIDNPPPAPDQWWYYALDGGQHVSLYHRKTLEHLAERLGLFLATDGRDLHLLTAERTATRWFRFITRSRFARLFGWSRRRKSLLSRDYQQLTGNALS